METGHNVVKTKGPSDGRFTFTSHEAGDHSICLSTNYTSWFSSTHIRLYLDVVVGSTKADADHDRSHVSELAAKVRDLNQKLEDINREQQYQRQRESDFRDLSEATNSRAVWYSLAQIIVLVATCTWQLRHLKVRSMKYSMFTSTDFVCSGSLRIVKCGNHYIACTVMHCLECIYSEPAIFRSTFFPYWPSAILAKISRTFCPATSSESSAAMVTISCSGA
jgi:hypothetical protein